MSLWTENRPWVRVDGCQMGRCLRRQLSQYQEYCCLPLLAPGMARDPWEGHAAQIPLNLRHSMLELPKLKCSLMKLRTGREVEVEQKGHA